MPEPQFAHIAGLTLPVYNVHTLVVGSGAAALNCADHLWSFGQRDLLIVTERLGGGASKNSGSDKQTYYKMSVAGNEPDSPHDLAKTLFAGGCMHGDIALVEATLSLQEFYHLVTIGVPFPHDRYGAFVGYKTDHDPRQRATSAGPRTSNQMVDRLLEQVQAKGIPVLDQHEVVTLLTRGAGEERRVVGAIAVNKRALDSETWGLTLFNCENIVLGIGGPGGMYRSSVYPEGQIGSIGVALEAGAVAHNLTESQYGMASVKHRWNVSGTYMQVIPTLVSTAPDGSDPREFLNDHFPTMGRLATATFLKGYQWPFDPRKVAGHGSSLVDLLVYLERVEKGRRVWLDFRRNPSGGAGLEPFRFEDLEPEAYEYLERSGALFGTPFERLQKMNPLAIDLYRDYGIDIETEPLEVAVCSQHNNGGLKVNLWWESNLRHLFPVGEVAGTHGVYRPGGSSLNSGQVGGYRAAQWIAHRYSDPAQGLEAFVREVGPDVTARIERYRRLTEAADPASRAGEQVREEIQTRMTFGAAHVRSLARAEEALEGARALRRRLAAGVPVAGRAEVLGAVQNEMLALTSEAYLLSIREYLARGGGSRGSYLVLDPGGVSPCPTLDDRWRFRPDTPELYGEVLEFQILDDGSPVTRWVPVRPIPAEDEWFENVWNLYLKDETVR